MKRILCFLSAIVTAHAAFANTADKVAYPHGPGDSCAAAGTKLMTYTLSGATDQAWAPDGVWADECGAHARFKSNAPKAEPAAVLEVNEDGSYTPVGIRMWAVGVWDLDTRSPHLVFKEGTRAVSADATHR